MALMLRLGPKYTLNFHPAGTASSAEPVDCLGHVRAKYRPLATMLPSLHLAKNGLDISLILSHFTPKVSGGSKNRIGGWSVAGLTMHAMLMGAASALPSTSLSTRCYITAEKHIYHLCGYKMGFNFAHMRIAVPPKIVFWPGTGGASSLVCFMSRM